MAGTGCLPPKCKICEGNHFGPRCPKYYGEPKVRVMSAAETKAAQASKKLLLLPAPPPAPAKKKAKKK